MIRMVRSRAFALVIGSFVVVTLLGVAKAEQPQEDFNPKNFDRSTIIDNKWYPLKPGMRYVLNGFAVDEEGDTESHSHMFTVTDLVKQINGVRTVVCWDRDFIDKELEEAKLMFFAQDNDGAVWLLGEYPEEYSDKTFVKQACWIHGLNDGRAGIVMKKEPKLGMTWSEGLALSVEYSGSATVSQLGEKVKTPVGSFENVAVVEVKEQDPSEAPTLKFYARRTGLVHVGWKDKPDEGLDLYKIEHLTDEEVAKAREGALKMEKHAYETSKDVYAKTPPSERNPNLDEAKTQN